MSPTRLRLPRLPLLVAALVLHGAAPLGVHVAPAGAQELARGLKEPAVFKLASSAVADRGTLPARYSCDGNGVRPPLEWSKVPAGTKSFVLVLDDASNRKTFWARWLVYNIPASVTSLPEGGALPEGAREGRSDWNKPGYDPPCPAKGRRDYVVTLYALNSMLPDLGPEPTRSTILNATDRKVIGWARLFFSYTRAR